MFHGRLVVHLLFRLEGLYYIVIALSFCCCCRNPGCCSVIVEKDDRSSGGKLIKKKGRRGRKGARIPFLESEWRRRNLSPSFSLLPSCARRFRALVPTNWYLARLSIVRFPARLRGNFVFIRSLTPSNTGNRKRQIPTASIRTRS